MDEEVRSPWARRIDWVLLPIFLVCYFFGQHFIGDVSLEGLDRYVLSAPAGSTREQLDARVAHFRYCYYRSPRRTETANAIDYRYYGTTSDVGYFVSVDVHCPIGAAGTLAGQCTRTASTLFPSDVDAYEQRTHSYVNTADEYSNAGDPECPVRD